MTREDAVQYLIDIKTDAVYRILSEEKEAIDMAIDELEQEPCEDVVSRQAVLDLTGKSDWFESSDDYNDFVIAVCELPPVNPQEPKSNIKTLGDEMRICQKSITDEKVLIGFNMAVAICNKHFAEMKEGD